MLKIGELAKAAGVTPDAIRLYETRGLLTSQRGVNGYRLFVPATVDLLRTIRLAQRLGFTLREVKEVLGPLQGNRLSAERIRDVLTEKLSDIDAKIADLNMLRDLVQSRLKDVCALGF